MRPFVLFLIYVGIGVLARPLYMGADALGKKLKVVPVTIALDVAFAFVVVAAALLPVYLFNDGILSPYYAIAVAAGYLIARSVV